MQYVQYVSYTVSISIDRTCLYSTLFLGLDLLTTDVLEKKHPDMFRRIKKKIGTFPVHDWVFNLVNQVLSTFMLVRCHHCLVSPVITVL